MINLASTNGSFKIDGDRYQKGDIAQLRVVGDNVVIRMKFCHRTYSGHYTDFGTNNVAFASAAALEEWFIQNAYVKSCCDDEPEPPPPHTYTLTFQSNPGGATIKVNGANTNTFTGTTGQTCTVTATLAGYNNYSQTYTVGSSNQTITLNLTPAAPTHKYYFGEAGVIYALSPDDITQANWDTHIKPKLNVYNHANLQNSYSGDAVVNAYQWWMLLIPSSVAAWVSQLPQYKWQTWNQLDSTWVDYDATEPETGTVVLDGIEYTYLAIQPPYAVKIRLIKN